jgi:DnaJ-class molecular chaperone
MSLYDRLGVQRNAGTDEIKKAYRNLAREHHPDKGGDADRFKEIQEAHEVLTDERRRQVYDATGSTNEQAQPPPGPGFPFSGGMGGFAEMFGGMFGQGGHAAPRGGKGPSNLVNVGLKLENFYRGFEVNMNFKQMRKCRDCASSYSTCEVCGGSGARMMAQRMGPMMVQTQIHCNPCGGRGQTGSSQGCSGCAGKRMIEKEKTLTAKIIPGMREGERVVFAGECSETPECDEPGDIVVALQLEKGRYEWRGDDLWCKHTVSYAESIMGFEVKMGDHPGGSQVYRWMGGPVIGGTVLTMTGGGMPRKNGGYGDLKLMVEIQKPQVTLSDADREVLGLIFGLPTFVSTSYQILKNE